MGYVDDAKDVGAKIVIYCMLDSEKNLRNPVLKIIL